MRSGALFLWFWTFWRWSEESYRVGALLRDPLHGFGGNWEAWFCREATDSDLWAIAEVGAEQAAQRRFIAWILRSWAREADRSGNRMFGRFVVTQLGRVPPFDGWAAFGEYRVDYGARGLAAVVLRQGSAGEDEDVRAMQALALPDFSGGEGPRLATEGFQADEADLSGPRHAALAVFGGTSLVFLMLRWAVSGRRPYRRWQHIALAAGWLTMSGLIGFMLVGPDPGSAVVYWAAALVGLWGILAGLGGVMLAREIYFLLSESRVWVRRLQECRIWLSMEGGLTLKGGSAGLAFCLNTLLALHRAYPLGPRKSWVWRRIFDRLRSEGRRWAATGAIGPTGRITAVVLEAKLRACAQQSTVKHLLTPKQRIAPPASVEMSERRSEAHGHERSLPALRPRLGFAAEPSKVSVHPCSDVVGAIAAVVALTSRWQTAFTVLAITVNVIVFQAASDLRFILAPPPPPIPIAPASPTANVLWVSLDTADPHYFEVVLESEYWVNRRAELQAHSGPPTGIRAEIQLVRANRPMPGDASDGTVWIERRRRFLGREYQVGERVGRYSVSYLSRLGP